MKFYSKYTFTQSPSSASVYILDSIEGELIPTLKLLQYKDLPKNQKLGIANKQYIKLTIPRSPSIRRYFAYVLEIDGSTLSSIEGIDEHFRTFGDTKSIGLNDLILIQFSADLKHMELFFVKNEGSSRTKKSMAFTRWNLGDKLSMEA